MPFLSLLFIKVIMYLPFQTTKVPSWQRLPPRKPPYIQITKQFIHEWNMGLHGTIHRPRFHKNKKHIKRADQAWTTQEANASLPQQQEDHARTEHDVKASSTQHTALSRTNNEVTVAPENATNAAQTDKADLLALLYSLTTPRTSSIYHFDTDIESICVDTGASACLSTKQSNFVNLKEINNIKINGIASGLMVKGIGTLKWSI
jgi:hypothetical protein